MFGNGNKRGCKLRLMFVNDQVVLAHQYEAEYMFIKVLKNYKEI